MNPKYYFTIQGYEQKQDTGALSDVTTFEILEETPDSAMARAKKLEKKAFYRFSSIIQKDEKHDHA